ncbi:hypothetical protein AMD27_11565 [Acinetobacter sp. TGL-Y2]|nr:hypothetical protein AMD27_11565 [Acinetobacter sp. TGL-Y2]
MRTIDTRDFENIDIPQKYQHDSFVQFTLSFNPRTDSKANDFKYPLSRLPTLDDSIISIRVYLYSIQSILNQHIYTEQSYIDSINESYKILRDKKNRE